MIEVYKEIKNAKEIEGTLFTGRQAVGFAMKSFLSLKSPNLGDTHIDEEFFGSYMITQMKMYVPGSIEKMSESIFKAHKDDEAKKSNVQK